MARGSSGPWFKYGCLTVAALGVIAAVVLGIAAVMAISQNRSAAFEHREIVPELPDAAVTTEGARGPVRLKLEVHTAGVSVKPIAVGEPIQIETDHDPRLFEFEQSSEWVGDAAVLTVELRPLGSKLMALMRVKLGGRPAMLRIALPRDIPLEIEGRLYRSFAAMELGGLSLDSTQLDVEDGGVRVSFVEPLAAPMERLSIVGNRGSISVIGVGNASPRKTRMLQHIGAMDVDLRGEWRRNAEVEVIAGVAGGSLWLPGNVKLQGSEERLGVRTPEAVEQPMPTLDLTISEHMGRFVVMD